MSTPSTASSATGRRARADGARRAAGVRAWRPIPPGWCRPAGRHSRGQRRPRLHGRLAWYLNRYLKITATPSSSRSPIPSAAPRPQGGGLPHRGRPVPVRPLSHDASRPRRAWLAQTLVVCPAAWPRRRRPRRRRTICSTTRALHDVLLTVSQRDWDALKANPRADTYYPADLRWSGVTVRNVGIRSRGTGTRNGVKPGLRVDMNRYIDQTFLGLRAARARQRLHRSLDDARGAGDEDCSRAPGCRLRARRTRGCSSTTNTPGSTSSSSRSIARSSRGCSARRRATSKSGGYLYEYNWVREYGFEYLGPSLDAYAELFDAEDARDRCGVAAVPAARSARPRHQRDAARPSSSARSAPCSICRRS